MNRKLTHGTIVRFVNVYNIMIFIIYGNEETLAHVAIVIHVVMVITSSLCIVYNLNYYNHITTFLNEE